MFECSTSCSNVQQDVRMFSKLFECSTTCLCSQECLLASWRSARRLRNLASPFVHPTELIDSICSIIRLFGRSLNIYI